MLNPLRFTKIVSLPRPEPTSALLVAAAGAVAPQKPAVSSVLGNLGRLHSGLTLQLDVVSAGLDRLRPPPPTPVTLQDRVREARHRLTSGVLAVRQTKLLAARQSVSSLATVLGPPA